MDFDPETTLSRAGQTVNAGHHGDGASSHPPASHTVDAAGETHGMPAFHSSSSIRTTLEQTLADLDGGAGAVACSTGLSAVSAVTHLLDADAHLICARECSADTTQFFSHLDERGKPAVSYEDLSDLEALMNAVRPTTAALWVETPSTPHLRLADLEALSQFADAHDLLLIVDNTVLSPILQRPIEHGADLVVYSSIQRLDGHGDVTGGAVIAKTEALAQTLEAAAARHSLHASPDDCRLILRGTKTLSVRVQQQENNARSVAYALNEHPAVKRVFYPGLRDHPGHTTARRQQDGYGGLMSVELEETVDVHTVLQATDVFSVDETRGGVESTIAHPASMSPTSPSPEQPDAGDLSEHLVRLSVGIESTDDLLQDLEQALEAAQTHSTPVPERKPREPGAVRMEA